MNSAFEQLSTKDMSIMLLILGTGLQSLALGLVRFSDTHKSFVTRAVGTITITLLLLAGSLITWQASSRSASFAYAVLLVPVVRADLTLSFVSNVRNLIIWAATLRTTEILFANEVFPLQAAAMIWNDCKPVGSDSRHAGEEKAIVLTVLHAQRQMWQPTPLDGPFVRIMKLLPFVLVQVFCWVFFALETWLFTIWRRLFERGARNETLVMVDGERVSMTGHSMLISDHQLKFLHNFVVRDGDAVPLTREQSRETQRVLVRAVHLANLLTCVGYTRLYEHSPGGHAMSEYFAAVAQNPQVRRLLSCGPELQVLSAYPSGNVLTRGGTIPAQLMWARIIVGTVKGLNGEGTWRGSVACALFSVAQRNMELWGRSVDSTALHRHVYTVSRKWLVDWMMFIWWEIDIPSTDVQNINSFFNTLQTLLLDNLVHNTSSLPHAVAEMVISQSKQQDTRDMLSLLLGDGWELWVEQTQIMCNMRLVDAVQASGDFKCVGLQVNNDITIDAVHYRQKVLKEIIHVDPNASLGEQVRACVARQIVHTLTERIKHTWIQLPDKLINPPDTVN